MRGMKGVPCATRRTTRERHLSLNKHPRDTRGACPLAVEGLACLVIGQVPQDLYDRPVDGLPDSTLSCAALIPKAKATAGEPSRTSLHLCRGEVSRKRTYRASYTRSENSQSLLA